MTKPSQVRPRHLQIIGPVGSGKTCTCVRFGERFEVQAKKLGVDLKHLHVNLRLLGGSRVVLYRNIVQQAAPEVYSTSLSAEELLYQLVKQLKEAKKYIIFTLDEIDYFLNLAKDSRIIYDLTRLDEIAGPGEPCGLLGLIFTARSKDFYKKLDEAELSSLGRVPLEFERYSSHEVYDIIGQRASEGFNVGKVSDEVIEYVADITGGPTVKGDIRYALDLLLFSGTLAEHEGASRVTAEHVRRVVSRTLPSITTEDVVNLPEKGKLVLLAVARALKSKKTPYASLREIRGTVGVVCEEHSVKVFEDVEEVLEDLADRGIVDVKSLTEVGISGAPVEELSAFLDDLISRVKESIA